MTAVLIFAGWCAASVGLALVLGAAIALRDRMESRR